MNIEELRTQTKRFFNFDPVFVYPANLDSGGEIVLDMDCESKQVLGMDILKGEIVIFYEEKPMFVVVSMINQSLARTQLCETLEEAVEIAVGMVENWQVAYVVGVNDKEIRGYLNDDQEYHFTNAVHEYSVYIGQLE